MVILWITEINETRAKIEGVHYMPELLTEEERSNGILVDSIPEISRVDGKLGMQYINPITKNITTEYIDDPNYGVKDVYELIAGLQTENTIFKAAQLDMQMLLAEMMGM